MKEYIPRFSDKEYERRHRLVREGMETLGIDCLLIPTSENITYLANVSYTIYGFYLLFPRVGDPTLFANLMAYRSKEDRTTKGPLASRYWGAENSFTIEDSSVIHDIQGISPPNMVAEIAEWIKERGLEKGTIGVAGKEGERGTAGNSLTGITGPMGLRDNFCSKLTDKLPNVTFTDGTKILNDVRVIKSAEEIESIRNATRIADLAAEAVAEEMKRPGVKEGDLFAAYFDTVYRNGGGYGWFIKAWTTQTSDPQDLFHLHPYDYTLQEGDIFLGEFIPAWKDGYVGHAEVSFVIGEPAQAAAYEKMNEVCLACYNGAVDCLRPGVTPQEILEKADKPIADAGFMRGAPLLYNIGLCGHQPPFVGITEDPTWSEPTPLESGMTIFVISQVYDDDTNVCVRAGDTRLITDAGSECLNQTSLPRGLVRIKG